MKDHEILIGDNIETMKTLAAESVHCCITSPPYFGLRRYFGGEKEIGQESELDCLSWATGLPDCGNCYICHICQVADELWRVLRNESTFWLNLGDSYVSSATGNQKNNRSTLGGGKSHQAEAAKRPGKSVPGLKAKDQCLVPHRVAMAIQARGWYLRSTIVWNKPAALPESVQDRCTNSHEYIFMFAKSERYYYDQFAIREPACDFTGKDKSCKYNTDDYTGSSPHTGLHRTTFADTGRNKRTVWTVPYQPFDSEKVGIHDVDHYAMFPPALITPCVLAGTSEAGVCAKCGAPMVRRLDGFSQSCECDAVAVPATIIDPFGGSGTTAVVAKRYGRYSIICELNADFARIAAARLDHEHPTLNLF